MVGLRNFTLDALNATISRSMSRHLPKPLQNKLRARRRARKYQPHPQRVMPDLFQAVPPPAPQHILPRLVQSRAKAKQEVYPWSKEHEDNPVSALYLLYQYVILDYNEGGIQAVLEYWWFCHSWKLEHIPDPKDLDPGRYACLAALTGLLVLSVNRQLQMGIPRDGRYLFSSDEVRELQASPRPLEKQPSWAKKVTPLEKTLIVPTYEDEVLLGLDDERASVPFKAKNILLREPAIHCV